MRDRLEGTCEGGAKRGGNGGLGMSFGIIVLGVPSVRVSRDPEHRVNMSDEIGE